jgi:hypothetical protein
MKDNRTLLEIVHNQQQIVKSMMQTVDRVTAIIEELIKRDTINNEE